MPKIPLSRVLKSTLPMLLTSLVLAGCAKTSGTTSVSVTAINYTDQELNGALFEQPNDENQVAGGQPVRPFEGGGMMCCFSLPTKWKPGIKVKLMYDWWQGRDKPRKYETKLLDVPPYPDGEAGTLWALFYADGSVQVVSSNYAPGHAKWPGKIKGGPVPTLEHRRKMWQMDYDEAKSFEQEFLQPRDESDPGWEKQWASDRRYGDVAVMKAFFGFKDPNYRKYVRQEDQDRLIRIKAKLERLEELRP